MKKETMVSTFLVIASIVVIIIGGTVALRNEPVESDIATKEYNISLLEKELTMVVGDEHNFSADIDFFEGTGLIFKSSNPEVVRIDSNTGFMEALSTGEAAITVSFEENEDVSDECVVTVVDKNIVESVALKNIYFSQDSYSVYVGDTLSLGIMFYPENTTNKGLSWVSSNTKVATVENGVVTGLSEGSAVITAKSHDGGFQASTTVEVREEYEKVLVDRIQFNVSNIDLHVGDNFRLYVTFTPSNAINKEITWFSDNPSVASIGDDGVIEALNEGVAIISASTSNGRKVSCKVTVDNK